MRIVQRELQGGTGWQRPIGCLKLQVIFRKRATNHRALLRKISHEDEASYDSWPPCIHIRCDLRKKQEIAICPQNPCILEVYQQRT